MAHTERIRRKELRQPDEFVTLSRRAVVYVDENRTVFFMVLGGSGRAAGRHPRVPRHPLQSTGERRAGRTAKRTRSSTTRSTPKPRPRFSKSPTATAARATRRSRSSRPRTRCCWPTSRRGRDRLSEVSRRRPADRLPPPARARTARTRQGAKREARRGRARVRVGGRDDRPLRRGGAGGAGTRR